MGNDLKVCKKCGWYEHGPYRPNECRPISGAFVAEVIAALPQGAKGTKLGYGVRNFAVTTNDITVVFRVDRWIEEDDAISHTYAIDRVFGADGLQMADVVTLAKVFLKLKAPT